GRATRAVSGEQQRHLPGGIPRIPRRRGRLPRALLDGSLRLPVGEGVLQGALREAGPGGVPDLRRLHGGGLRAAGRENRPLWGLVEPELAIRLVCVWRPLQRPPDSEAGTTCLGLGP